MPHQILVLGAGNFGTCLGHHLAKKGHAVTLWTRSEEVAQSINQNHRNPKYLNEISLSPQLHATISLDEETIARHQAIVLAVPAQTLRMVLPQFAQFYKDQLLITAAKGIELETRKLPSDIVREFLGDEACTKLVSLSGPSFAIEVAQGLPTGVSAASKSQEAALSAQNLFHTPTFRVYTSDDPIGLEVCGALKNVIALCAGACAGLGFQNNSLATVITRGLAEMTRIGVALGANPLTFHGLGGVGDLFLTCSSRKSRNYTVGYLMGQGQSFAEVMRSMKSVAEGVPTTKAAYHLGQQLKIEIPITTAVYRVLYENLPIAEAARELMTRDASAEQPHE